MIGFLEVEKIDVWVEFLWVWKFKVFCDWFIMVEVIVKFWEGCYVVMGVISMLECWFWGWVNWIIFFCDEKFVEKVEVGSMFRGYSEVFCNGDWFILRIIIRGF